uniref:GTP-binding protein Di-Ras2 n=1 Tax=Rhabditophanes sp. KR3021 TaxID=114890 RepID=A0AC35U525_9BILA
MALRSLKNWFSFRIGIDNSNVVATSSTTAVKTVDSSTSDYRVVVYGSGGIGKTSIVVRFVKGIFSEAYVPTIEDTYRQVISCNQKNVCTLEITDTTGSHQFPAMQRLSVSKGNAFILVYSITSSQSLKELEHIIRLLKEIKGDRLYEFPIILVGNKKDDQTKRQVSVEQGMAFAAAYRFKFIETSAKDNENIIELFETLLALEKKRQLTLSMDKNSDEKNARKGCFLM